MGQFDHIKRMITLSVITLSGFHCTQLTKIRTSKLTKIRASKVVDHYYKNQNIKKNEKNIESLSFV